MSVNMVDPKDVWPHIIKSKSSFLLKEIQKHLF